VTSFTFLFLVQEPAVSSTMPVAIQLVSKAIPLMVNAAVAIAPSTTPLSRPKWILQEQPLMFLSQAIRSLFLTAHGNRYLVWMNVRMMKRA
tara:strand:- start:791 stop:1063 length:273 start_codon:yes stop_codon:yes gene_type:complete